MMSSKITVHCKECGIPIRIYPQQLGREVRCSHCQKITLLAESHDTVQAEPAAHLTLEKASSPHEKIVDLTAVTKIPEEEITATPEIVIPSQPAKRALLRRKRSQVDNNEDLTPMVDVTFLLLIFFMVTSAFALQRSLEVPPPESESESAEQQIDPDQSDNSVIIRILRDNSVWIEDRKIPSRQQLLAELKEMVRPSSGLPPVDAMLVFADGSARYETVVMVLDAGNAVSMKRIQLKTEDQEDP